MSELHRIFSLLRKCPLIIILILFIPHSSYAYDPGLPDSVIFGNLDGSHITALPGDTIDIPVWIKTDESVATITLPLATEDQFVVERLNGVFYDFLTFWDLAAFGSPFENIPDQDFTSQMLAAINELSEPWDDSLCNTDGNWLKIADFTILISPDSANLGLSFQLLEGGHPYIYNDLLIFSDSTGFNGWRPDAVFGFVDIGATGYEYLPGDANMNLGLWPPAVINADASYLIGYFTGNPSCVPCKLDGFWASADANGDCLVIGSDVTTLINYFLGLGTIEYCPDFEPAWPTPDDLPADAPPAWPNCEPVIINGQIIPTGNIGAE